MCQCQFCFAVPFALQYGRHEKASLRSRRKTGERGGEKRQGWKQGDWERGSLRLRVFCLSYSFPVYACNTGYEKASKKNTRHNPSRPDQEVLDINKTVYSTDCL